MKKMFFISRDANWQLYRNEVLSFLGMKKGIKIEILTTGELKPYLKENEFVCYKCFKDWFGNSKKINFFPSALLYIIQNRPDTIVAQNGALNLTEYFALILSKFLGIRFVWWTRAYEHKPLKNSFFRNIRQFYVNIFLRSADAIIVYSKIGFDFLIEIGCEKEKIYLAYNTLDTHRLKEVRRSLKQDFSRHEFIEKQFPCVKKNSRFILFVGRVNRFKKVHNLIKAMKIMHDREKDVHLIIIGEGDQKENCIQMSKDFQLNGNVHFKGAIYDENEVNKFFEIADVYSIPGSVGLGIVHAFSFGLPLVTENLDYHSAEIQYLKNGYNGLIVEEENVDMLADTLLDLLNDKIKLKSLGANALNTIENEANIDVMIEAYFKALFPEKS
jgi:1,2-diacylglycerol 3-alpha-glucosyltransferase